MGKLKQKMLKSVTLVETIVALVIIVAITGITVMVFVQVTGSGYSISRIKAEELIQKFISSTEQDQTYSDEEFQEGDFVVIKQILQHEYSKELVWMKISVFDRENSLLKYQNIFLRLK